MRVVIGGGGGRRQWGADVQGKDRRQDAGGTGPRMGRGCCRATRQRAAGRGFGADHVGAAEGPPGARRGARLLGETRARRTGPHGSKSRRTGRRGGRARAGRDAGPGVSRESGPPGIARGESGRTEGGSGIITGARRSGGRGATGGSLVRGGREAASRVVGKLFGCGLGAAVLVKSCYQCVFPRTGQRRDGDGGTGARAGVTARSKSRDVGVERGRPRASPARITGRQIFAEAPHRHESQSLTFSREGRHLTESQ